MDPQRSLEQLYDALQQCSFDEAEEAAEALKEWLDRGGFPPVHNSSLPFPVNTAPLGSRLYSLVDEIFSQLLVSVF